MLDIPADIQKTVDDIMSEVVANGWDWSTEQCMARAVLAERERIAQAMEYEASVTPCSEDAMVTRSNATLVRANFSYEDAERISETQTQQAPEGQKGNEMIATWRDHINEGEQHIVLEEYDDGSAICLSGYTGGGSPLGYWGGVTLMKIEADGTTRFRNYEAVQENWSLPFTNSDS